MPTSENDINISISTRDFQELKKLQKGQTHITQGEFLFKFLGAGSYNRAYLVESMEDEFVIKIQHANPNVTDLPARSVRLFNELNAPVIERGDLQSAKEVNLTVDGYTMPLWATPYIEYQQASFQDIHQACQEAYKKTNRILIDAIVSGNVVKDKHRDSIVFLDVGLAPDLKRRDSLGSIDTLKQVDRMKDWLKSHASREEYREVNNYLLDTIDSTMGEKGSVVIDETTKVFLELYKQLNTHQGLEQIKTDFQGEIDKINAALDALNVDSHFSAQDKEVWNTNKSNIQHQLSIVGQTLLARDKKSYSIGLNTAVTSVMDSCAKMQYIASINKQTLNAPKVNAFKKIMLRVKSLFERVRALNVLSSIKSVAGKKENTQTTLHQNVAIPQPKEPEQKQGLLAQKKA